MFSQMMRSRCAETDCRAKGFVLEIKFKSEAQLKSLFKSKIKFDFIFFVQEGTGRTGKMEKEKFNLGLKSLWPRAIKVSIVTDEGEESAKTVDRVAHHLKMVSTV